MGSLYGPVRHLSIPRERMVHLIRGKLKALESRLGLVLGHSSSQRRTIYIGFRKKRIVRLRRARRKTSPPCSTNTTQLKEKSRMMHIERITSIVYFERFISLSKAKRTSLVNWVDRDLIQRELLALPNTQGQESAAGRPTPLIQSAALRP
jgi:hypothetical protein